MSEIHDIVEVEVTGPARIRVTFDDREVRDVAMTDQLWGEVFAPLRDPDLFSQVRVDSEMGTVVWPTGADLDPIVIYECLPPLHAVKVEIARS